MPTDLRDFLIPVSSGVARTELPPDGYLARGRLAKLRADLQVLADHRARAMRELRNGGAR